MAKVHVIFACENCDAEGDGFRDESDMGAEECWQCGEDSYFPTPPLEPLPDNG